MHSYGVYSKVVLNSLTCDQFIPRLIRLVVSIIWTKAKLLSITLWLVYDGVNLFSNQINLCYSLAYKECFSI